MAQSWVPGDEKLSRIYGALLALADAEHAFVNFVHASLVERASGAAGAATYG